MFKLKLMFVDEMYSVCRVYLCVKKKKKILRNLYIHFVHVETFIYIIIFWCFFKSILEQGRCASMPMYLCSICTIYKNIFHLMTPARIIIECRTPNIYIIHIIIMQFS